MQADWENMAPNPPWVVGKPLTGGIHDRIRVHTRQDQGVYTTGSGGLHDRIRVLTRQDQGVYPTGIRYALRGYSNCSKGRIPVGKIQAHFKPCT